jgi:hypothetical protein
MFLIQMEMNEIHEHYIQLLLIHYPKYNHISNSSIDSKRKQTLAINCKLNGPDICNAFATEKQMT